MLKITNQSGSASYIYIYIYRATLTLLLLSLPVLISLTNIVSGSAYAESLDYDVIVQPSLALTLSSPTVSFHLNPASNSFNTGNLDISVATNNLNGYKLYIGTAEGSGSTSGTDLTNTTNNTYTIPILESNVKESSFVVNKWGYRISAGTNTNPDITDTTTGPNSKYFPYASNTLISSSASTTNNDTATLTFAAKADYEKPAGVYDISLNFKTIPIVTQTYMQNMDPSVCTEAPTIVIDSRDEQPYLIQRLADGKCWMLDNLDLDLTNESIVANLTTENTNIDTTNDPYALESLKNGARSNGDKYATAGLEYHNWTGADMTPLSPNYSYSQPLVNRSGKCDSTKNSGYPCVGVWQDADYTHNTILDKADAANTIIKDNANNIGGPGSYKIGTYYNYCAATAGTYCYGNGTSSAGTPPENSSPTSDICPAGWHMPSDNGGTNGDYLTLCSAIKEGNEGCTGEAWNAMSITDSTSMQYQLSTPLSGRYDSGTAYWQGTNGYFWSTTYSSGASMRYFLITSSSVYPLRINSRPNGKSVRCVSS